MKLKKKILSVALSVMIATASFGAMASADESSAKTDAISVERVSGSDRYSTAVNVSRKIDRSQFVVLASGEGYVDALIGSSLSVQNSSPLLLTRKNQLPSGVKDEIRRLGAKEVFVLGGVNTVSESVVNEIKSIGVKVKRLSGAGRFETAQAINDMRYSMYKGAPGVKHYAGTDAYNFPDALVAGPFVAFQSNVAEEMYLYPNTSKDKMKLPFSEYFGNNKFNSGSIKKVYAGKDRYTTAIKVAEAYKSELGMNVDTVVLVNGKNYPDALSASTLSAKYNAPVILTTPDRVNSDVEKYIRNSGIKKIVVVGGENSVKTSVADAYASKTPVDTSVPKVDAAIEKAFPAAKVVKVSDGDTITVNLGGKDYKIRMIGVDTPETVHPSKPVQFYGKEASNFTKASLTGKTVYLQKDVSETDKYGRLLRYVWTERPSHLDPTKEDIMKGMYNAKLLADGYAHAVTFQPDSKYAVLFAQIQSQARQAGKGLWKDPLAAGVKPCELDGSCSSGKATQSQQDNKGADSQNSSSVNSSKPQGRGVIRGNVNTKIYHCPGQRYYNKLSPKNTVYFNSEKDAINAGYKKSKV